MTRSWAGVQKVKGVAFTIRQSGDVPLDVEKREAGVAD
jgi:hypothetical protein